MATIQLFDRYSSTLASGYTSGGGSLSVTSATGLPSVGNFYVKVLTEGGNTEEVFLVTAISGTTLTVTGAQAQTSASDHGSGATITGFVLGSDALRTLLADRGIGIYNQTYPPAVSGLTWGNQGTSTVSESFDGFILTPQIAGSWNPRSLYKSKGANKRFTIGFRPGTNTTGFRMGMVLYDSGTSKVVLFEWEMVGSSAPRFNSTYLTSLTGSGPGANWGELNNAQAWNSSLVMLQYYDDGTSNRNFYSSGNGGRTWHLMNQQSRTANSMTPDNWGVFYNGDSGSTTGDIHVIHWLEEAS